MLFKITLLLILVVGLGIYFPFIAYSFKKNKANYKFLFRNTIYSEVKRNSEKPRFELGAVMRGKTYKSSYLYIQDKDQYLVKSHLTFDEIHRSDEFSAPRRTRIHRFVLMDKSGQTIRTLDTDMNFSARSGLFYTPKYYVNWLEESDTTQIAYDVVFNEDLLMSKKDFGNKFRALYAEAEYIEYVHLRSSFNDLYESGVVFKINDKYTMLLSGVRDRRLFAGYHDEDEKTGVQPYPYKVSFDYYDPDYGLDNPYPNSPPSLRTVYLETQKANPFRFNSLTSKGELSLSKYEMKSKTGWQGVAVIGWLPIFVPGSESGTCYMKLNIDNHVFRFKIPEVEKLAYQPVYILGVRVFKLPKSIRNASSLSFVVSTQNTSHQIRPGGGVYVVRPTKEIMQAELPISLQIALLDTKGTSELAIESGKHHDWYPEIERLENLTYLNIRTRLEELPESIANLAKLKVLILPYNRLQRLPSNIEELRDLRILDLYANNLQGFPESICSLSKLIDLSIGGNNISNIPPEINQLTKLQTLGLLSLGINTLPATMLEMKQLSIKRNEALHERLTEEYDFLFEDGEF
ncbi:MAG: leucine-rich repeat domain-containing protein [Reichenbachiella sp.]